MEDSLLNLNEKKERTESNLANVQNLRQAESKNLIDLQVSLQSAGGGRIQSLKGTIEEKSKEKDRRLTQHNRYDEPCSFLGLPTPKTVDEFITNKNQAQVIQDETKLAKDRIETEILNLNIDVSKLKTQESSIIEEIESLRSRQSNIPKHSLDLRANMARELNLNEQDLPFVGELLQVKSSEKKWQGSIERVLRSFGLSILVSEKDYLDVSAYVNRTHLKDKLVYFRVNEARRAITSKPAQDTLLGKLDIKKDSQFTAWLRQELEEHFNFICCESVEDFQKQVRAISISGQIKSFNKRHEKDDRFRIDDKSRYILGWSNKEKIESLKNDLKLVQHEGQKIIDKLLRNNNTKDELDSRMSNCQRMLHFLSFEDINWYDISQLILSIEKEIKKLTAESSNLKAIEDLIKVSNDKIQELDNKLNEMQKSWGALDSTIKQQEESKVNCLEQLSTLDSEVTDKVFPHLDEICQSLKLLSDVNLTNLGKKQNQLRDSIQSKIDALSKIIEKDQERIIKLIGGFLSLFPEFTTNIDASPKSLAEISNILQKLKDEDLPRHEQRFYKKLKEDTIKGMAMFQELLEKEKRNIEGKIKTINACLRDIDYNEGTYISILLNKSADQEIVTFRNDLRQILSNTAGVENVYNEQKFTQVKTLIDRFRGRQQFSDIDKKWTAKVTDVRNWFTFAASEKFHADNSEKEFYPDSGGKSGGQKEKLAYTVLASALAYQYGIDSMQESPKSFRFVMIDEAFGRGSDESARYGLTLFEKLNLQLLVVTPLQKIHVIEDYVSHVHFVHNEASKESRLHTLTIEQFRESKNSHRNKQAKVGDAVDA